MIHFFKQYKIVFLFAIFSLIGVFATFFTTRPLTIKATLQPPTSQVTLIAVGDIMPSRNVAKKIAEYKNLDYPFLKTSQYLQSADITFANLESPVTPGKPVADNTMSFRTNPDVVPAIARAGIDIVSLANNHTPNYGAKGLLDTFKYLKESGIAYAGAGKNAEEANAPTFISKNGITFAFLAYNDSDVVPASYEAGTTTPGTAFMRIDKMTAAVKAVRSQTDIVIVSMHSGIEYTPTPDTSQKNFAHAAIDAGANMVIGHHPHVVQSMEKYNGKYIFYSLGNFVFDQMWSAETRRGMTLKIVFTKFDTKTGVTSITPTPIIIDDFSQPRLATEEEAKPILKRLQYSFVKIQSSFPTAFRQLDLSTEK